MKSLKLISKQTLCLFLTALPWACNGAKFDEKNRFAEEEGQSGEAAPAVASPVDPKTGVSTDNIFESANGPKDTGSNDCVQGDVIKLALPPEIRACMDQGRIYSFNSNECLEAQNAPFECKFDVLAQKVAEIGVRNRTIIEAKDGSALMVACGARNGGNTLIAQWYYPASGVDKCTDKNAVSKIVTACYKQYGLAEVPTIVTKEDYAREQLKCLKE